MTDEFDSEEEAVGFGSFVLLLMATFGTVMTIGSQYAAGFIPAADYIGVFLVWLALAATGLILVAIFEEGEPNGDEEPLTAEDLADE